MAVFTNKDPPQEVDCQGSRVNQKNTVSSSLTEMEVNF